MNVDQADMRLLIAVAFACVVVVLAGSEAGADHECGHRRSYHQGLFVCAVTLLVDTLLYLRERVNPPVPAGGERTYKPLSL
jgi:hypothetical protein